MHRDGQTCPVVARGIHLSTHNVRQHVVYILTCIPPQGLVVEGKRQLDIDVAPLLFTTVTIPGVKGGRLSLLLYSLCAAAQSNLSKRLATCPQAEHSKWPCHAMIAFECLPASFTSCFPWLSRWLMSFNDCKPLACRPERWLTRLEKFVKYRLRWAYLQKCNFHHEGCLHAHCSISICCSPPGDPKGSRKETGFG